MLLELTVVVVCAAIVLLLGLQPARALDKIEAVGAQRCGGRVKSYTVEFLAPEAGSLVATAKTELNGRDVSDGEALTLTLDGKLCTDARCTIDARKGQEYRLVATRLANRGNLCIVVARR